MIEIVVALVGATGAVIAAWSARSTKREVRTNDGKRAGEYLEMIPTVLKLIAEHETSDNVRFGDIDDKLLEIQRKVDSDRRFTDIDDKLLEMQREQRAS